MVKTKTVIAVGVLLAGWTTTPLVQQIYNASRTDHVIKVKFVVEIQNSPTVSKSFPVSRVHRYFDVDSDRHF